MHSCREKDCCIQFQCEIASDQYYTTEILPEKYVNIYNTYKLAKIQGGKIGLDSLVKDTLILKFCPFGIVNQLSKYDSIEIGKIELISVEKDFLKVNIHLPKLFSSDLEKQIYPLSHDSLWIRSDCCDRFDYLFIKY